MNYRSRRIAGSMIAIAALVMLGARTGRAEHVRLRFWQTMNENETLTLRGIVDEFERAYPTIAVQMEYVPYGDAKNKFDVASQTGTAPDVMRSDVGWTAAFADLGYLLPLDEYVSAADKADYLAIPFAYNVYEGQIWGIPQVTDALALLYNKRLLQAAGYDAPPATLAEMEQMVADMKAKLGIEGFFMRPDPYWFQNFLWAFGGELADAHGTIYINNPASVAALTYFISQKDRLFPGNIDFATDYNDMMTLFKEGKAAMILNGPWATADILTGKEFQDPANLGVAPFPKGPNGDQGSPVGGHNLVISGDTEYPAEAYEFIQFITQTPYQVRFTLQNNLLPTRQSAYEMPDVKRNPLVQGFLEQMKVARNRPVIPETADLYPDMTTNLRAAWRGDKTPQQAMDDIAAAWQTLLQARQSAPQH